MDLIPSSVQQLLQKFNMSSPLVRTSAGIVAPTNRFVAGLALLDHDELNAEAFVFRRLARLLQSLSHRASVLWR